MPSSFISHLVIDTRYYSCHRTRGYAICDINCNIHVPECNVAVKL